MKNGRTRKEPAMAKRARNARTVDAKSRLVYTNGGFALVIDRGVWPKWLQDDRNVRITEILPTKKRAKKGAKR